MTVNYENTKDDIRAMTEYYRQNMPNARTNVKRVRWIGIFVMVLLLVDALFRMYSRSSVDLGLLIAPIVGILLMYAITSQRVQKMLVANQMRDLDKSGVYDGILGTQAVTIEPQGLRCLSKRAETLLYWSAIKQIEVIPDYIVVKFGVIEQILIPRRTFRSEAREQEFLNLCTHYRTGGELVTNDLTGIALPATATVSAPAVPVAQPIQAQTNQTAPVPSPSVSPPSAASTPWYHNSQAEGSETVQVQRVGQGGSSGN